MIPVVAQLEGPTLAPGFLAVLLLSAFGLVMLAKWMVSVPTRPDPWSDEVAAEIAGEDSTPVCHRCLTPHSAEVYFCPECGAPVGTYTNWLPFPYLFSIGHTLRIGTEGTFKRSPLVIAGFFLFSLAEYTVFAPVYWVQFLKHVRSPPPPNPAGGESTASGHDDDLPNLPG